MGRVGGSWHLETVPVALLERIERAVEAYSGEGFLPERSWYLASRASLRARELGLGDLEAYVRYLEGHAKEEVPFLWTRLRVGHTAWMRHGSQLRAAARLLSRREPVRVWVAGCGTGEEVYSLAAALLEAGQRNFFLLGTDLSPEALATAKAGSYGQDPEPPTTVRRVLVRRHGRWEVSSSVRRRCRFLRHNLLEDPPGGPWQAIFCRNVLVYFTERKARQVIRALWSTVDPGGLLVVAPTELSLLDRLDGELLRLEGATLLRKSTAEQASAASYREWAENPKTSQVRHRIQGTFRDGDQTALESLLNALAAEVPGDLELDLDGVSFLADAAAEVFRALASRLAAQGRRLELRATRPGVRRWIERNGLGHLETGHE